MLWIACLYLAALTFQCGGGGSSGGGNGGGSGSGSGGGSGTAALSSLSPIVTMQNGSAFTLTANGSGFGSGDQVVFNGTAVTTTVVNSTQLTATIPASAISQAGTFNVTVGSNSSAQQFYVVPAISPTPVSVAASGTATANITVPAFNPPTLQLQEAGISPNAGQLAIPVNPGQSVKLFVVGMGVKPGVFFEVSGNNDVTVTQPLASDFPGTQDGQPGAEFKISVSASAALGPRNLIVTNPAGEISIFPGGIVIVPGS